MEWSKYSYLFRSQKYQCFLFYSSLSDCIIKLNDKLGMLVRSSIEQGIVPCNLTEEVINIFKSKRLIVPSNELELQKIILTNLRRRFDSASQTITVAPTLKCNFACPYCYEQTTSQKNSMEEEVENALISYVEKQSQLSKLNVIWYGGEPTIAIPTIERLTTKFKCLVKSYSAFMVTNGYLLDKLAGRLSDPLSITGLQVTLDGLKDANDKMRILKCGRASTFDTITRNLKLVLEKDPLVSISIRMNITRDNAKEFLSLRRFLATEFDEKINLYPAFVHNYGCADTEGNLYTTAQEKAELFYEFFEHGSFYAKELYPSRCSKGCMMQVNNSFVVAPDGSLYKCWHHVGKEDLSVGNLLNDYNSEAEHERRILYMTHNDALFSKECHSCFLFPSCNGGCTDLASFDNQRCIVAKSAIEEFLELRYQIRNKRQTHYEE